MVRWAAIVDMEAVTFFFLSHLTKLDNVVPFHFDPPFQKSGSAPGSVSFIMPTYRLDIRKLKCYI